MSVPGLHDTVYGYDTEGRPETVTTGTRESVFAYDTRGNLASVTDPEENVFTYDYDDIGRVTAVHRPDITDTGNETVIAFDYDENGNMTFAPDGVCNWGDENVADTLKKLIPFLFRAFCNQLIFQL